MTVNRDITDIHGPYLKYIEIVRMLIDISPISTVRMLRILVRGGTRYPFLFVKYNHTDRPGAMEKTAKTDEGKA